MNNNKKQILKIVIVSLCSIYICSVCNSANAENITSSSKSNKNTIAKQKITKNRDTTEIVPITPVLRDKIVKALNKDGKKNVIVQFSRHPTKKENRELGKVGIKLIDHIGSFRWRVAITKTHVLNFSNPKVVKNNPVFGLLQSVNEIKPQSKVLPQLLIEGVFPKHRHKDGTIEVNVGFYRDVSTKALDNVLTKHNAKRTGKIGVLNNTTIRLPKDNLLSLAAEDTVQWIEPIGLGDSGSNFYSRTAINSIILNDPGSYNLSGLNVRIGIWDEGLVDASHGDLTGRVTPGSGEPTDVSNHATHVAGTLAGDGSGCCDPPDEKKWQGVAPDVHLYSYSILEDDDEVKEHSASMIDDGIDISNNSWGDTPSCSLVGYYVFRSEAFDQLVHGIFPGSPGPLPIVFAAGNNGPAGRDNCAGSGNTAGTLRQPGASAKNPIVVGDVDIAGASPSVAEHSSRGPTWYGMLKPDVVAPGCSGTSCEKSCYGLACRTCSPETEACSAGITSTVKGNTYALYAGTSMAASAVTGTMALMLEQYRKTFHSSASSNETLLPSSFKAILIHTAEDLGPEGPDYESGYGLINAQKAVDLIQQRRISEGKLANAGDADIYTIPVTDGDSELRVTLAWDDYPSVPSGGDARVENQLDLLVISPSGDQFYSPWQLEPATRSTSPQPKISSTEAAAYGFRDIENVVEQIVVLDPNRGLWKVKVKAESIHPDTTEQKYSLVTGPKIIPKPPIGLKLINLKEN